MDLFSEQCDELLAELHDSLHPFYSEIDSITSCVRSTLKLSSKELALRGSWANNYAGSQHSMIDFTVETPASLFYDKDFLDGRYIAKQRTYLESLVSIAHKKMKKSKKGDTVRVTDCHVEYEPRTEFETNVDIELQLMTVTMKIMTENMERVVRIIPVLPHSKFPVKKLHPSKRNNRLIVSSTSTGSSSVNTPNYTNGVMKLAYFDSIDIKLHAFYTSEENKNIRSALLLFKIWMNGRRLVQIPPTFPPCLFYYLASSGASTPSIFPSMNPFDIFRVALEFVKNGNERFALSRSSDTTTMGKNRGVFHYCEDGDQDPDPDDAQAQIWRKSSMSMEGLCGVFVINGINILGSVHREVLVELADEADQSLLCLQNDLLSKFEIFETVLTLTSFIDPMLKYDDYITVYVPNGVSSSSSASSDSQSQVKTHRSGQYWAYLISSLLRQGYGSRVTRVRTVSIDIVKDTRIRIVFGISLNPDECNRGIDRGPTKAAATSMSISMGRKAMDKNVADVAQFKKLWGSKCELRRFRDGTLAECVVWDVPMAHRYKIIYLIAVHLLGLHFEIGSDSVSSVSCTLGTKGTQVSISVAVSESDQDEDDDGKRKSKGKGTKTKTKMKSKTKTKRKRESDLLLLPEHQHEHPHEHPHEQQQLTIDYDYATLHLVYQRLVSWLRNDAIGVHPTLRGRTGVRSTNTGLSPASECFNVSVSLEGSGKWPDEIEALRRIKTAFLIKIGEELAEQHGIATIPSEDSLDVIILTDTLDPYAEPHAHPESLSTKTKTQNPSYRYQQFIFRVRIVSTSELAVLKMNLKKHKSGKEKENEQDDECEYNLQREIEYVDMEVHKLPLHCTATHAFSLEHPSWSLATRILKRWLSSKMLIVSDEVVELITAHVYLKNSDFAYSTPFSGAAGFRKALHLIATFDWNEKPLIVDLDKSLNVETVRFIHDYFDANFRGLRVNDELCTFIASGIDKHSKFWTFPSRNVWRRVVKSARNDISSFASTFDIPFSAKISDCNYDIIIQVQNENADHSVLESESTSGMRFSEDDSDGDGDEEGDLIYGDSEDNAMTQLLKFGGFNPLTEFLKRVMRAYGHLFDVYCDRYGSGAFENRNLIGLVWKRRAFLPSGSGAGQSQGSLSLSSAVGLMPIPSSMTATSTATSTATIPNPMEVLSGIRDIGGEYVVNVVAL